MPPVPSPYGDLTINQSHSYQSSETSSPPQSTRGYVDARSDTVSPPDATRRNTSPASGAEQPQQPPSPSNGNWSMESPPPPPPPPPARGAAAAAAAGAGAAAAGEPPQTSPCSPDRVKRPPRPPTISTSHRTASLGDESELSAVSGLSAEDPFSVEGREAKEVSEKAEETVSENAKTIGRSDRSLAKELARADNKVHKRNVSWDVNMEGLGGRAGGERKDSTESSDPSSTGSGGDGGAAVAEGIYQPDLEVGRMNGGAGIKNGSAAPSEAAAGGSKSGPLGSHGSHGAAAAPAPLPPSALRPKPYQHRHWSVGTANTSGTAHTDNTNNTNNYSISPVTNATLLLPGNGIGVVGGVGAGAGVGTRAGGGVGGDNSGQSGSNGIPPAVNAGGPTHVRKNTRITLTDITSNPLEDEAENAILRALEAREWENRQQLHEDVALEEALHGKRAAETLMTDSARRVGLLTGIPDEALQMVMEEQQAMGVGVAAGMAAAETSNSSLVGESIAASAPSKPASSDARSQQQLLPPSPKAAAATAVQEPPRSPRRSPTGSSKRSPKFEDIAAQLKDAQGPSSGGGYLLKAAQAYGKSTRAFQTADETGSLKQKVQQMEPESNRTLLSNATRGATKGDGATPARNESTPATRLANLQEDSDSDDEPLSATDKMVKGMNMMLGLPNKIEDTEQERRNEERRRTAEEEAEAAMAEQDAFDIEAQTADADGPKLMTAGSRWSAVKAHIHGDAVAHSATEAFKAAGQSHAAGNSGSGRASQSPTAPTGRTSPTDLSDGSPKLEGKGAKLWSCLSCIPGCGCCSNFMKKSSALYNDVTSTMKIKRSLKILIGCIILPSMFVSAILFYAAGNPMTGTPKQRSANPTLYASYSWWVLFIGARQVCTLALSRFTEIMMVDVLTLRTRTVLKVFGPFVSLLILQARGWPYIITFWAIWNFALLQGKHSFAKHWLYYTRIRWFGECSLNVDDPIVSPDCNPAGAVITHNLYFRILIAMIVFGCCVALKRVLLALQQGKKTTSYYGPQLEKLMKRMLFISEIASLANEIENAFAHAEDNTASIYKQYQPGPANATGFDFKKFRAMKGVDDSWDDDDDDDDPEEVSVPKSPASGSPRTASPKHSPHSSPNSRTPSRVDDPGAYDSPSKPPPPKPQPSKPPRPSLRESVMRFRANTEDLHSVRTFVSLPTKQSISVDEGDEVSGAPQVGPGTGLHAALGESARIKLRELVGEWEEPVITSGSKAKTISIQDVLQFRQAVLCLDSKTPFSYLFGPANTRENCIESAQNVYNRLLLHTPGRAILTFDTLALITLDKNGEIDERKARKLIRLFRPARDGSLTCLDFVKSCDKVYKDLRTLRAAIANSSQLDVAMESLVNVGFYFILWLICLTIIELDPWTLFLSLSGFILSFAFMFGTASSKYFEGILLILVQKPYDIGDRIHISNSQSDTSANGSATWFVEGVNLYSTTVRYATTNEVATHSNGSLAGARIINAARSPKANAYVYIKFASDVPYEKVMLFKTVVEEFVKERPREWISMNGFRATRVEADMGYIEYVVVLQHVEKWQNIGPILNSKAEVASYCLEVQKKLGMRYEAPPLPVNLGINRTQHLEQSVFEREQNGDVAASATSEPDFSMLATLFTKPEAKKTR